MEAIPPQRIPTGEMPRKMWEQGHQTGRAMDKHGNLA
jgi:hypothetical protein